MIAGTIATRAQLPLVRVLAASFRAQHPSAEFVTLILDGTGGDDEPFELLTVAELELEGATWGQLATGYGAEDLISGLKPFLLRNLLIRAGGGTAASAVVMEAGIRVFAGLDEAFKLATSHGTALVPRVLAPLPDDGDRPSEADLAVAGPFNDRAIWVGGSGEALLGHWAERVSSPSWNGRAADQAWLGLAPTSFDAHVLRNVGYGVSHWNLPERQLRRNTQGALMAGNRPLRFMDFSGYDPECPWRLSCDADAGTRVGADEVPLLRDELDRFTAELRDAGAHLPTPDYGLGDTPDGIRLAPVLRRAYRRACFQAAAHGDQPPPAAFDVRRPAAFAAWLTSPVMGPARLGLGPLERQLWTERPDLRTLFPDPAGLDAYGYRAWLDSDPDAQALLRDAAPTQPPVETEAPAALSTRPGRPSEAARGFGWNVVGYLAADSEAGETARRMASAFEAAAVLTRRVNLPPLEDAMTEPARDEADMANSLYCVDAGELARTVALTGAPDILGDLADQRGRRIGFWRSELPRFPDPGALARAAVDEVWCPSQFVANAVSSRVQVPVKVIPLPASTAVGPTRLTRQKLGLPDDFVFYFSYELAALVRKNPLDLIQAYSRAFSPDDGTRLVLRSSDGNHHRQQLARVRWAARGRPDIHVLDLALDPVANQAMIELTDCFVSLHRAEAFGIAMATAMAAARPVIATAYSGNLDFMDERSAYLVPYALRPVGAGNAPYPATGVWAKPDLEVAAQCMRKVFDEPERALEVGLRAAQRVRRTHGLWQSATAIAREVDITLPRKTGAFAWN